VGQVSPKKLTVLGNGVTLCVTESRKRKESVFMKKADFDYLILFSSPSCPQCRGLKESLKKTGLEYEESDDYDTFNVTELPTLVFMEAKKNHRHEEKKRHVGYMTPDELNEFVKLSSCGRRMINE
jgi:glutaredoxin